MKKIFTPLLIGGLLFGLFGGLSQPAQAQTWVRMDPDVRVIHDDGPAIYRYHHWVRYDPDMDRYYYYDRHSDHYYYLGD